MAHIVVPEAEAILDQEFPVLDQGFVRLVDYLGGDARIVQSARVSYGEGTTTFRRDRGLIRYLMEHQHTSPFEQVILTFHAKMPIFVARQWIRHRTARLNEISGRYSVMKEEFYVPDPGNVRYQSETNRQGRSAEEVSPELQQQVIDILKRDQAAVYANYQEMIDDGIARELARINLPLSLYTEWYWQIDLHNLFHFLELRRELHAQWEIRQYADRIYEITKTVAPVACEAFEDFVLHGARFSKKEIEVLRDMLDGKPNPLSGYELREFERKLYGKHTDEA
jgi:thymidylate synthase (FAD)